jgi:hypothetical protein
MLDRADPHARERALAVARQHPPPGASPERRLPKSLTCWNRSATPAWSVPPTRDRGRASPLMLGLSVADAPKAGWAPLLRTRRPPAELG